MSLKTTLVAGAFGAAAIFAGRQILKGGGNPLYDAAPSNNKAVPIIPGELVSRNGWSGLFWILPAAGAFMLSK